VSPPAPLGVLVVVANYDDKGGLQVKVRDLAGHESLRRPVVVLTWAPTPCPSVGDDPTGAVVMRVPCLLPWSTDHHPVRACLNTAVSVVTAVITALACRKRWSVVYAAGLNPEGVVAALVGRVLRRPYVLDTWLPGPFGNVARLQRSPVAPLLVRLLRGARASVAETTEIAGELRACGLPADRVLVVRRGVDLVRFHPVDDATRRQSARDLVGDGAGVVAYCGRIDLRHKRLDLLLDAWEQAGLGGWELVLAGDGPDAAAVVRRGRAMTRGPVHLGWRDDIASVLAGADIYVLPTNFEATGRAVLEGMACGLPGLVSATPAYADLRPDGVVLVDNTVAAWTTGLVALASDAARRTHLGRRARAWVETNGDVRAERDIIARLLDDS